MSIHRTYIEGHAQDEEIPVRVHYQFHRAIPGSRDGRGGLKLEPDEPAHIEIDAIERPDGLPVELSRQQEERILEEIGQAIEDEWQYAQEQRYESRRDN